MRPAGAWLVIVTLLSAAAAAEADVLTPQQRGALLARAHVWREINTRQLDLYQGPQGDGSFPPGALVSCDFEERDFDGNSPKFMCRLGPDDIVKVKYGRDNGEVHGEVAASRLLWALGFLADRMYPVRILCRGCPEFIGVPAAAQNVRYVDPAVIERPLTAEDVPDRIAGWSWAELAASTPAGGDAREVRLDALRLMAAFLQHTDSKPEQQRLVCLEGSISDDRCRQPFLMINDLGLTFGRASFSNTNRISSANLDGWRNTKVWKEPIGCVANLRKSFTGTLRDPVIGEEGRSFLTGLLSRLSEKQLHGLFSAAGMDPEQWTPAFIEKRREVADRRCGSTWAAVAPPLFSTDTTLRLQRLASPPVTAAMNGVSVFGYTRLLVAVAVVVAFLVHLRAGAALLLLIALTGALSDSAKAVAGMPRPDTVDSRVQSLTDIPVVADTPDERSAVPSVDDDDVYGFPSGHMAAMTALLLGLAFLVGWRGAWMGAAVLIPIMAVSRLYLGRHFPADIIGGIAVGCVATGVVVRMRLSRLDDVRGGRRTALRVAALGIAAVILALVSGVPHGYEAGRVAGVATALAALALTGNLQQPVAAPYWRITNAGLLFLLVWWLTSQVTLAFGLADSTGADMLLGGLPAFVLLPGPLLLERWLARLRLRAVHP